MQGRSAKHCSQEHVHEKRTLKLNSVFWLLLATPPLCWLYRPRAGMDCIWVSTSAHSLQHIATHWYWLAKLKDGRWLWQRCPKQLSVLCNCLFQQLFHLLLLLLLWQLLCLDVPLLSEWPPAHFETL
jgi:hypothetical protein